MQPHSALWASPGTPSACEDRHRRSLHTRETTSSGRDPPSGNTRGCAPHTPGRAVSDNPKNGGKARDSLKAGDPAGLNLIRPLPSLTAAPVSPPAPFTNRNDGPTAVLGVALVHRHLAPGPLPPPLRWKGAGPGTSCGAEPEGEGGDYGAKTEKGRARCQVTWWGVVMCWAWSALPWPGRRGGARGFAPPPERGGLE